MGFHRDAPFFLFLLRRLRLCGLKRVLAFLKPKKFALDGFGDEDGLFGLEVHAGDAVLAPAILARMFL